MKEKILLVDDEQDILELINYNLTNEGFNVFCANDGIEAIKLAKEIIPDLIILDVMMPVMDGMEACIELRKIESLSKTVITFLSARSEDYSHIAGFEAGADDYITKPIKPRVLISKIKALLRRNGAKLNDKHENIASGRIILDRERFVLILDGTPIDLPKKEFELLELLMMKPGRVYTRDTILNELWAEDVIVNDRTIDVHIRKIRAKIGDDYIKTVKGVGYKFEEDLQLNPSNNYVTP